MNSTVRKVQIRPIGSPLQLLRIPLGFVVRSWWFFFFAWLDVCFSFFFPEQMQYIVLKELNMSKYLSGTAARYPSR